MGAYVTQITQRVTRWSRPGRNAICMT